jgi:hypothetical protein
MTDQPPVQPPNQPPDRPAQQPGQGSPPTQPMSAAASPAAPTPSAEPQRNLWHRATSTPRGIWAVGLGAGALAVLMILGIGLAGLRFCVTTTASTWWGTDRTASSGAMMIGATAGVLAQTTGSSGACPRGPVFRTVGAAVRVGLGACSMERLCTVR